MTLGEFREWTKDLPDSTDISYHSYYKGCGLTPFKKENCWIFPKKTSTEDRKFPLWICSSCGADWDDENKPKCCRDSYRKSNTIVVMNPGINYDDRESIANETKRKQS